MSVVLEPSELGFRRPFSSEVTQLLRLKNQNNVPIAFKVKTTAPKHYCVRPNSGRIEVGGHVEVQVLLQAMKEDPPLDAKCRDKFLVQSVAITPERDLGSVTAIWSNVESIAKGAVEERKIRVVFLPADGSAATPSRHANGAHNGEDSVLEYGSPPPYGTPAPESKSLDHFDSKQTGDSKGLAESAQAAAATTTAAVTSAATSVANTVPTTTEELKEQLAQAKATIANLTSGDSGLRQRKVGASGQDSKGAGSSGAGLAVQGQQANGVPVQIVAALCLLSFLLAYFFF